MVGRFHTYLQKKKKQDLFSLLGRLHTKDVLENHVKDQSFRLARRSNITLFLPKTCRGCVSSARKSYQVYFSAMYYTRVESGDVMVADLEELEEMDASELHAQRVNWNEVLTPRWNSQDPWRRSTPETIHLNQDNPNRRKEQGNLPGDHQHLFKTHRQMMVQQEAVSGPNQGTTFSIITLRESNMRNPQVARSLTLRPPSPPRPSKFPNIPWPARSVFSLPSKRTNRPLARSLAFPLLPSQANEQPVRSPARLPSLSSPPRQTNSQSARSLGRSLARSSFLSLLRPTQKKKPRKTKKKKKKEKTKAWVEVVRVGAKISRFFPFPDPLYFHLSRSFVEWRLSLRDVVFENVFSQHTFGLSGHLVKPRPLQKMKNDERKKEKLSKIIE